MTADLSWKDPKQPGYMAPCQAINRLLSASTCTGKTEQCLDTWPVLSQQFIPVVPVAKAEGLGVLRGTAECSMLPGSQLTSL